MARQFDPAILSIIEHLPSNPQDLSPEAWALLSQKLRDHLKDEHAACEDRLDWPTQHHKILLDSILEADPSGLAVVVGPELHFVYVNPAYRFICPDPEIEFIGQPYERIWSADMANSFHAQILEVVTSGRPFQVTGFERTYADGASRIFTFQVRRISWGDQPAALLILWDTTGAYRAEKAVQRQSRVLKAVNQIMDEAIHSENDEQLGQSCLRIVESITGSQLSFIGEIGADGFLHDLAISDPGWEACAIVDHAGRRRLPGNFKIHGLYGRVLLDGRSLITNDPASHPDRIGVPEGHPEITSFLGVPLMRQGVIIGMIAVANRKNGYTREEQEALETLAPVIVEALSRVREARALHINEEKFRATLGSIGDAVITTDAEGRVTFLNPVAERLIGWNNDEANGRPLEEIFPIVNEMTGMPAENPVGRVIEKGGIVGLANHTALIGRDGRSIPIEDSAAPIRGVAGEITGVVMVFHDVTEKRRADQALRESESRFHTLADNIPQLTWMADASGSRFWFNQRWFDYTGTTLEQMRGDGWQGVHHPDYVQRVVENMQQHFAQGEPWEDTHPLRGRDGAYRWFLTRAVPVRDEQGQVLRWFGTNTDVTERIQSEEKLKQLNRLIELSYEPIFTWDLDGGLLSWNQGSERLYGYSQEEALKHTSHDLLKTQFPVSLEEAKSRLRSEGSWTGQLRHTTKDGRVIIVDSRHQLFMLDGQPVVLETNRDITGLHQLNRTLKALSESSQAMMRAQDEAAYLEEICRIVTETCGYAMVWVGYAENDPGKTVRPVAYSGFEAGYLDTLKITWADSERGRGPTGTAIRTAEPRICRNMQTDPAFEPWRAEAVKRGYAASIALPFLSGGQAFGAITIYSRNPDPFSIEEVRLLNELAGDIAYGIVTLRIRQARQQAEKELREQQEWLRVTLSSIGDAVISTDTGGRIRFLNPVAEQLTGWSHDEVVGRPIQQVFHIVNEKTGEAAPDVVAKALNEKRIVALANHTVLVTKAGRQVPIEDSAAPILDAGGSLVGAVMVFHDVTEKRRAQNALRESEERLSLAIEGANMATWDLDLQTGQTVWSRRMFELLGYPAQADGTAQMDGWYDRIFPEDLDAVHASIERARREHRLFHSEHRITRADDGQVAWLRVFGRFSYDSSGEPLRFLGVLFDDTPYQQATRFIEAQPRPEQTVVNISQANGRASGIEAIDAVPWGTHFCQFYQSSQDLVDILVPYFRAGLEANEFCMWVTSAPLNKEQARQALRLAAPDLDRAIEKGQIEFLDYSEWYTRDGVFDADTILQGWIDKLADARQRGFEGLRLSGNTFWLEQSGWDDFTQYEEKINAMIGDQRMIALCTYSLDKCGVREIMDVLANHQFALIKRSGRWEIIENVHHKKTEQALRESEERLRLAIWAADLGVFEWDVQNDRAIWENPRMYEIFGRSPQEGPISKVEMMEKVIHPEDAPVLEAALVEGSKPGHLFHAICRIRRKNDGEWRWIEYNGRFVQDPQGVPVLLKGMIGDITERKQREEALRESVAREEAKSQEIKALADAVPALVWISHDPQSRVISGNRYSSEFLRMKEGDNLSKTAPEAEVPRHFKVMKNGVEIPPAEMPVQKTAATGIPLRDYEFTLVFDDGETRHLFGNVTPLFDEAGAPSGAVSAFTDITPNKMAQAALAKSEERYRRLFTTINEGFSLHEIICDAAGKPVDYRFLDVNPAFEEMTGLKREQVLGHTVTETIPGIEPYWIEIYGRVALTGEAVHFQNYSQPLGKYFEVVAFSPEKGQFASIFIDITERKRLEEEARLRAARVEVQRLLIEQREHERLQIARDLHDGPVQELTAASFALQSLCMDCEDPQLNATIEELRKSIQNQIAELRAYAAELRPPTISRFGLEKAIRSHLDTFREKYPEIQVEFDAHQDGDLILENQRLALFRIYQQAMNNVVKHAQASEVKVWLRKDERHVELEVVDNGRGFAVPNDLLEIARQGHLGLVGMRERAEAIGGAVQIISEPGNGATIRVIMPLEAE